MFIRDADLTCLRQGDILAGIPFPLLKSDEIAILGRLLGETPMPLAPTLSAVPRVHRGDPNWLTGQVPMRLSFCAVLSQCCDLELREGKFRMHAFAVARLIPIPEGTRVDPQRLASLMANKDPRDPTDPGRIDYFYIPAHERLDGKEWLVDYNQA